MPEGDVPAALADKVRQKIEMRRQLEAVSQTEGRTSVLSRDRFEAYLDKVLVLRRPSSLRESLVRGYTSSIS